MAHITNPRTRMVTFRVTAEEFERLKTNSSKRSRSLSDFARLMMLEHGIGPVSFPYDDRFQSFDQRVAALERSMAQLVEVFSPAQLQRPNSDN